MNKAEQRHLERHDQNRRAARLRAVQALFQMDLGGIGARRVVSEFLEDRLAGKDETGPQCQADTALFEKIVLGVVEYQDEIDQAIRRHLAQNWRLERLDATLRALLRAAGYEILHVTKTPAKVILNQYVDLAGDFFDGPEAGFVNAALESLARAERTGELTPP